MDNAPRTTTTALPAPVCEGTAHRRIQFARSGSYEVRCTTGGTAQVADVLAGAIAQRRALVVTTPTVNRLVTDSLVNVCNRRLQRILPTLVVACSEEHKTQANVDAICDAALAASLDRTAVLIGVGGGVCLDLVTMAAAGIRRGLAQIRVPTTLIGQVDAGIGIKGALNFRGRKATSVATARPSWFCCTRRFSPDFQTGIAGQDWRKSSKWRLPTRSSSRCSKANRC